MHTNKPTLVIKAAIASALVFATAFAVSDCTQTERQNAKTVIDVATDACREFFGSGQASPPPGVSIEEFCSVQEHLQPFEDALLGASKAALAAKSNPDAGK